MHDQNIALVTAGEDGALTTDTERIAEGTHVQHKNVLGLVRDNLDDLNEFGLVAFETRPRAEGQHGGGDRQVAILNEQHATLLLTYMRNTPVVREFKKRLVHEFYAMRDLINRPAANNYPVPQSLPEALRAYAREVEAREAAETYAHQLEPKAEYVDRFVSPDDCIQIRVLANQINMPEGELRELLVEKRWIYKVLICKHYSKKAGRVVEDWEWRCYADKKAFFRLIPQHKVVRHHNNQVRQTLYVTPPGVRAVHKLVGADVIA